MKNGKEFYKAYRHNEEPKNKRTQKRILRTTYKKGLKTEKINRVVFKQTDWLRPCIHFNTDKRKKASSDFDKDL